MIADCDAASIVARIEASPNGGKALRREAMEQLSQLPHYNWSGVYRLEGEELVLDEYIGAPTDHIRIPIGRGVCGTAVATGENQIVEDVNKLSNYLACSLTTKSEIVVLIKSGATVLGQIDIDGHTVSAFDRSDEAMLERVAQILAERWH